MGVDELIAAGAGDVVRLEGQQIPPILAQEGAETWQHLVEYFTGHIRNPNTRAAYGRAVMSFFWWCESNGQCASRELRPVHVAAYVEEMSAHRAAPTVKQHLAAIRMLFDWFVVRQILPMNPAAAVRGPRHVVKKGKTPVLSPDETRRILDGIDTTKTIGLRDRALIGILVLTFARISVALLRERRRIGKGCARGQPFLDTHVPVL